METRITGVADGIDQFATFVGAPFGFNKYGDVCVTAWLIQQHADHQSVRVVE